MSRRVVVTGMGLLCPLGLNIEESWTGLIAGRSGISAMKEWEVIGAPHEPVPARIAGVIKGFDPDAWLPEKKDVRRMDRFMQFALAAAHQAWLQSGLPGRLDDAKGLRAGAIFGAGFGGVETILQQHEVFWDKGALRVSAYTMPASIANMAPGNMAIRYNLRGPNWALASACASSTHAIGEAFYHIRDGRSDIMLTGGAEAPANHLIASAFGAARALCTSKNDDPTRASRPFERSRDGFVLGEGSGMMVIEELEHARRRGATILAELAGYGSSCDAFQPTAPPESGEGAARCMQEALDIARLNPGDIGYINAHGTSTPMNDKAESNAIKSVFGHYAKNGLAVSASKSMTGHLLGAAGAVEAVISILALQRGVLPPTVNYEEPDPECDLDYVPNVARDVQLDAVMSNGFGFGGANATLVMRKCS